MKNKILLCAFAVALGFALLTSCKKAVDVDAICDNASTATLVGVFSGAEENAMTLHVAQYNFGKDGAVTRTVMAVGDGIYEAPVTTNYSSWEFGEYVEQKLGRVVLLNPANGGEPLKVTFMKGGIMEEGQPAALDKNDKVSDVPAIQTALVGKKWAGLDTTFYRIDTTINVMKVDSIVYKHKEGKKYVIDSVHYDTTYVPTKMKWSVGPSEIAERRIELYRDAATNVNTGKWYMMKKEYSYDASRTPTLVVDSTSMYDFHWSFASFASAAMFEIVAVDAQGKSELFEIKYDSKKPALVIDKQELLDVTE